MIKISVFHSNQPGKHFDINYYCTKYIPMVRQLCGPLNVAVDHGVAGGAPDSPAPFLAMGHHYFEAVDLSNGVWPTQSTNCRRRSQRHEPPAHHPNQKSQNL